jgi:hypothetical protein
MPEAGPGRSCPASYRYGARALGGPAAFGVDTLWVAGGLYGNPFALGRLAELYEREPGAKALVFNGDFHWFDVDPGDFSAIDDAVLAHEATRGNIETELARPDGGAGCGCAYPEWVDEATVEHSNRIIERLRSTARRFPQLLERLAGLPMHLVAEVGGERVAVVHGDADSLAGWGFSQESLATPQGAERARAACERAGVRIFASTHTCLPVLQGFAGGCVVANNGSAGMPNFRGTSFGLATRVSVEPSRRALYGVRAEGLFVEAVPIDYDAAAWMRRFAAQWPEGSDAHRSYYERIARGPRYTPRRALRAGAALAA